MRNGINVETEGRPGRVADGVPIPDDKTGDTWAVSHRKKVRRRFEDKDAFPGGQAGPGPISVTAHLGH